jgi:hypothetical protein
MWVRMTLSFSVSVTIGLAPLLGRLKIPGFEPLLALLPITIQTEAIVLSSVAMGLLAVMIQWYAGMSVPLIWLKRTFRRAMLISLVSFFLVLISFIFLVAPVEYEGGKKSIRYAVGMFRPLPDQLCSGLSDAACIQRKLSFNPAEIESYWGDKQIRFSELILIVTYTLLLSTFGTMIGLLVVRQNLAASKRRGKPDKPATAAFHLSSGDL